MGLVGSFIAQARPMLAESSPGKPTYSVDQIPDQTGKVIIVTGGNSGVGKETVKALLKKNAKVYMASRSEERAKAAIAELREETGSEAIFLKLDLSNLQSVKAAAAEFIEKEKELHVLFNNGGIMNVPIDQLSVDGYDLQWGTHVVGHFYFTKLLLPVLISTAQSSPDKHTRVLTTASVFHYVASIDFNTFKDSPARRKFGPFKLYAQSKFGDLVLAMELARRYGDQGIVSTAINPGNINTDISRHMSGFRSWFIKQGMFPPPMGALTQLWGATSPEGSSFNGKYLGPWAKVRTPRADSQDPVLGKQLWEWLEEQVKDL